MKIKCFLGFHNWYLYGQLNEFYDVWKCFQCGREIADMNSKTRNNIKHYCPICRKLEQECQCLEC